MLIITMQSVGLLYFQVCQIAVQHKSFQGPVTHKIQDAMSTLLIELKHLLHSDICPQIIKIDSV